MGFTATEHMQNYLVTSDNKLYDNSQNIDFVDIKGAIYSPLCTPTNLHCRTNNTSTNCYPCLQLYRRLAQRARRFYNACINKTLTKRNASSIPPTPGALQAVLKECSEIREEFDKVNKMEPWKARHHNSFTTFLHKAKEDTFLLRFLTTQTTNAMASGSRQREWDPEMIRFMKGLSHTTSGKKAIQYLTGSGNFGLTKDNNSNNNFNLHIPSIATLESYEDPGYYPIPKEEDLRTLQQRAASHATNNNGVWFILLFDGIHIKSKLEYDKYLDAVVGGERTFTPAEFAIATDEEIALNCGEEIVQFFLQSVDGGYTEPIGHWVKPYGAKELWVKQRLQELVNIYSNEQISIVGSSSDGDLFNDDLQYQMNCWNQHNKKLPWFHFYDYSHATRNARNALFSRNLVLPGSSTPISIRSLSDLYKRYPHHLVDSVAPVELFSLSDKMNMRDCLKLMSNELCNALTSIKQEATVTQNTKDVQIAVDLIAFITIIRGYYNLMERDDIDLTTKLAELRGTTNNTVGSKSIYTWLSDWKTSTSSNSTLASPTFHAILSTIESLYQLNLHMKNKGLVFKVKTSVLSTLVVEHAFSIARGILNVFTPKQFIHIVARVRWDLLERSSQASRKYGLPSDNVGAQSNRVYGTNYISSAPPPLRRKTQAKPLTNKTRNKEISTLVKQRTTALYTYREPGKVRHAYFQPKPYPRIQCPHALCVKSFSGEKFLANHLQITHGVSIQTATTMAQQARSDLIEELTIVKQPNEPLPAPPTSIAAPIDDEVGDAFSPDDFSVFTITQDMLQRSTTCVTSVVYVDIETTSARKFPDGAMCQIAAAHELENYQVRHTLVNPAPYIQPITSATDLPKVWASFAIRLHKIRPTHVIHAPTLKKILEDFFKWATFNFTKEVIMVAHNSSFDRSRLLAMANALLPDLFQQIQNIKWVDTRILLTPVVVSGTSKKSTALGSLIANRLPDIDSSSHHSADFDVQVLHKLVNMEFNNNEKLIKQKIIELANKVRACVFVQILTIHIACKGRVQMHYRLHSC